MKTTLKQIQIHEMEDTYDIMKPQNKVLWTGENHKYKKFLENLKHPTISILQTTVPPEEEVKIELYEWQILIEFKYDSYTLGADNPLFWDILDETGNMPIYQIKEMTKHFKNNPDTDWYDSGGQTWKSDIEEAIKENKRIYRISTDDNIFDLGLIFQ